MIARQSRHRTAPFFLVEQRHPSTGAGIDLPPGMRGESNVTAAARKKKEDDEEPGTIDSTARQQPGGLRDIQRVVDDLSGPRKRRKGKGRPSSPALEGNLADGTERSKKGQGEGGRSSAEVDAAGKTAVDGARMLCWQLLGLAVWRME